MTRYLTDLADGQSAVIARVKGYGAFRKRITEMGFVYGTHVKAIKKAPLQDPAEYELMGYRVSLRRSEASMIEVIDTEDALPPDAFGGTISAGGERQTPVRTGKEIQVALVGNPNSGKTTLFNCATGRRERVGNYGGVTVDLKTAHFHRREYRIELTDLPGTYSVSEYSPEELFVRRHLTENYPDVVVNVVDAGNLERNLFLTTQLIDMNVRVVIALNMYDELTARGDRLDYERLGTLLGIPVVPTVASRGRGVVELLDRVIGAYEESAGARHIHISYGTEINASIDRLRAVIRRHDAVSDAFHAQYAAIRLLEGDRAFTAQIAALAGSEGIVKTAREETARLEKVYGARASRGRIAPADATVKSAGKPPASGGATINEAPAGPAPAGACAAQGGNVAAAAAAGIGQALKTVAEVPASANMYINARSQAAASTDTHVNAHSSVDASTDTHVNAHSSVDASTDTHVNAHSPVAASADAHVNANSPAAAGGEQAGNTVASVDATAKSSEKVLASDDATVKKTLRTLASTDATVPEPSAALASTDATVPEPSRALASTDATASEPSRVLASTDATGKTAETLIADAKYAFIRGALKETYRQAAAKREPKGYRPDRLLTNRWLGIPLFLLLMWATFQLTFTLGAYPMDWIEAGVGAMGDLVGGAMADGMLKDLLVDGIIGGVIVFLPNILILFFCISLMEETGYMARAAFIMDRAMHRIGLHGKSFIPMLTGFGCSVPAIMATRTLDNRRDRILTMLAVPFMSCSARLPVYVLLVSAFFPGRQGVILLSIYVIGVALACLSSVVLGRVFFRRADAPFVMELPPYRIPTLRNIGLHTWGKSVQYLTKMGTVILAASVIVWALGYFPRHDIALPEDAGEEMVVASEAGRMEASYIGRLGHFIEPVIEPLGYDWKIGVSLVTGLAAKEIVVSSMGVLYQTDLEADETSVGLQERLREQTFTSGGRAGERVFTPLVACSFMLFVLIYFPCIAALAAIRREAGWRWALFSAFYTTGLAWLVAFLVYRIGGLL